MKDKDFLLKICDEIYVAEKRAQRERECEAFEGRVFTKYLVMRQDKVRVEIRKENVNHNAPHMHITHSDKIDVSICLNDFSILAGKIDNKTKKHLFATLKPKKDKLLEIWNELNEKNNSVKAEKLISNLDL